MNAKLVRRPRRREVLLAPLAGLAGLALTGCAGFGLAPASGRWQYLDLPGQRALDEAAFQARLTQADLLLLGERHDNPQHHQARARWLRGLARLGRPLGVVAEHLSAPLRLAGPDTGPLAQRLATAGFDTKAWAWPVHEALFATVDTLGWPLLGGNLPRPQVRQIAREGESAVPPDELRLLRDSPLPPAAQAALRAELVEGHCGQLAGARLDTMTWAQRARDASMALALQRLRSSLGPGSLVVLLAGNGHVRRDHGVAALLPLAAPGARVLSVGLLEPDEAEGATGHYDLACVTAAVQREDPCRSLRMG
jgi:uncharacterized iron-regulated protein